MCVGNPGQQGPPGPCGPTVIVCPIGERLKGRSDPRYNYWDIPMLRKLQRDNHHNASRVVMTTPSSLNLYRGPDET